MERIKWNNVLQEISRGGSVDNQGTRPKAPGDAGFGRVMIKAMHKKAVNNGYRYKSQTYFIHCLMCTIAALYAKRKRDAVLLYAGAVLSLIERFYHLRRSRKTLLYSLYYLERLGYVKVAPMLIRDARGRMAGVVYLVWPTPKLWRYLRGIGTMVKRLARQIEGLRACVLEREALESIERRVQEAQQGGQGSWSDPEFRRKMFAMALGVDEDELKPREDPPFWERNKYPWCRNR